MVILTCANSDIAVEGKDVFLHRNFSFKRVIQRTMKKAEECGYTIQVYDLGRLGIGERYEVSDPSFAKKGYYERVTKEGYKSKALFKPGVVKMCMETHKDIIVFLDGDAELIDNIDELATDDYDIGVTLRDESEIESEWHQAHFEIVKYVNAGVIFFNPTPATRKFVDIWESRTEDLGNDQRALNELTCNDAYPDVYSVVTINGVRVKYFPCSIYNFYGFKDGVSSAVKIMHFKGPVRHFFPFDAKRRIYCNNVRPILKRVKNLL